MSTSPTCSASARRARSPRAYRSATLLDRATCRSSRTDVVCDRLPTRATPPWGTYQIFPRGSRSRTLRSEIRSTTPLASPRSTLSPTPYWSSASTKNPAIRSRTSVCAPKASGTTDDRRGGDERADVDAHLADDRDDRRGPDDADQRRAQHVGQGRLRAPARTGSAPGMTNLRRSRRLTMRWTTTVTITATSRISRMRSGVSRCSSSRRWIQPGCASPKGRGRRGARAATASHRQYRRACARAGGTTALRPTAPEPGRRVSPGPWRTHESTDDRPGDHGGCRAPSRTQQRSAPASRRAAGPPWPPRLAGRHRAAHTGGQRAVLVVNVLVVLACFAGAGALIVAKRVRESFVAAPRATYADDSTTSSPRRHDDGDDAPPAGTDVATTVAATPPAPTGDVPRSRSAGDELPHHRQRQQRVHRPGLAVRRRRRGTRGPRQPQRHDHGAAPRPDHQGRGGPVVPARPVRRHPRSGRRTDQHDVPEGQVRPDGRRRWTRTSASRSTTSCRSTSARSRRSSTRSAACPCRSPTRCATPTPA